MSEFSLNFFIIGVYLCVDYDDKGMVDLYLVETKPLWTQNMWVGFGMTGNFDSYKVKRKSAEKNIGTWKRGKKLKFLRIFLEYSNERFSYCLC